MNRRRWTDNLSFLQQPVTRRDILIAFVITCVFFSATVIYGLHVQGIVVDNQCDSLNRQAETKLFLYETIERSGAGRTRTEAQEELRITLLTELTIGIKELTDNADKLKNCVIYPKLQKHIKEQESKT